MSAAIGTSRHPVADPGVCAGRATVLEVAQGCQPKVDDVVPCAAAHGRNERDATGIVLELRPV